MAVSTPASGHQGGLILVTGTTGFTADSCARVWRGRAPASGRWSAMSRGRREAIHLVSSW